MTFLLPYILAFLMLGMGTTLTFQDFVRVNTSPKAVLTGLFCQMLMLPFIGFCIVQLLPLPPKIAIGIMIIAACPGGATSNLLTHLSKGDLALSITLTALTSVLTVFTIPFIINFAMQDILGGETTQIKLDVWNTIKSLTIWTILPVIAGMFVRYFFPPFAQKSEKIIRYLSIFFILLALWIMVDLLGKLGNVWDFFLQAGLATFLLNICALLLGLVISYFVMRLSKTQSACISIETGIQNNVLGITIATVFLKSPEMGIAAGVYAVCMITTGFLSIYFFNRWITSFK